MKKIITRILLFVSLLLAFSVAAFAIKAISSKGDSAWATLAATLAVITSVISAWSAIRVVELEEDKLKPYPYSHFDVQSRYGLLLLRLTNSGRGTAHNIELIWDQPLVNSIGDQIRFSSDMEYPEVPILLPGDNISKIVDVPHKFLAMKQKHGYRGVVKFTDGVGKKMEHRFFLDAEIYRGAPVHDNEALKAYYEIQKLPEEIGKIKTEISKIVDILEK